MSEIYIVKTWQQVHKFWPESKNYTYKEIIASVSREQVDKLAWETLKPTLSKSLWVKDSLTNVLTGSTSSGLSGQSPVLLTSWWPRARFLLSLPSSPHLWDGDDNGIAQRAVWELIIAQRTEQYLAHRSHWNYYTCITCAYFLSHHFLTLWST